jgi:hypothetical protein
MRWIGAVILMMMPTLISAQVVITEIMYDLQEGSDSGREWIEVYNSGEATVDLSKWKLVESGKNHKISKVRGVLDAGTYAIIADNSTKFADDHPEYVGALFDSAFSLSNDGETLSLVASGDMLSDELRYEKGDGAAGTGDSLQRIDIEARVLSPGVPTPGGGIPEGGLNRTPQTPKNAKSRTVIAAAATPIVGEPVQQNRSQMAVASVPVHTSVWWMGVAIIALWGAGGIVYARRARMTEWEIIEES